LLNEQQNNFIDIQSLPALIYCYRYFIIKITITFYTALFVQKKGRYNSICKNHYFKSDRRFNALFSSRIHHLFSRLRCKYKKDVAIKLINSHVFPVSSHFVSCNQASRYLIFANQLTSSSWYSDWYERKMCWW